MSSITWRARTALVVSAVLGLSLMAAPAQADEPTASVHGVITSADTGDVVAGAEVSVSWFDGQGTTTTTTDENGQYVVDGIPTEAAFEFTPGTELTGEVYPPEGSGLRIGFFPAQGPLAPGEDRQIDVALRSTASTAIDAAEVCLGASFSVNGYHWDAGSYLIRARNGDGVDLLTPSSTPFAVAGDGEFEVPLTARADAPAGEYTLATSVAGSDEWTPLDSGILAKDCTFLSSIPTINGTAAVGGTLSVDRGEWDPDASIVLQWFVNGVHVEGWDDMQLELTSAHLGKSVTAVLTGEKEGFDPITRSSTPTGKIITAGTPTITGSAAVGSVLTAKTGTWTTGMTFSYQWRADGAPIAGATTSTFTPTAAQDGQQIRVSVTGKRAGYATVVMDSAATKRVMKWATPKISGYAAYGLTLTAVPGTWSDGTTFTYQWLANGKAVSGATGSTFKLGTAQKGATISVKVTGRGTDFTSVAKTSASTAKTTVAGTPTVSGSLAVGATVTAKTGTWSSGTTFTYQWYADGAAISGATKSTLKLGAAQKGKSISVRVTGKKSGYATVPKTSKSTALVATAGTPSISGSAKVTYTLTAQTGTWTPGTTFTYQWYANGAKISGATAKTLKLGASLAGKRLEVVVTGKNPGYATISKRSAPSAVVGYPSRTAPTSLTTCPSWAPIKGNADSMIYHLPGGRYYNATHPEDCFRTESAAVAAGYRKSKV